jgi:hypothetical protein
MAPNVVTQDSRVTTQSIYSHRTDRRKQGERFERNKSPFIAISILFDRKTRSMLYRRLRVMFASMTSTGARNMDDCLRCTQKHREA